MKKRFVALFSISCLLCSAGVVFAKTDLSISETDVTFSKEDILSGDTVTVYARIFNIGDTNVFGNVVFLNNDKEISDPQPVSVRPNTYDDVFVRWRPAAGTYNITAKITGLNPADDDAQNNSTIKKEVLVDSDTDHDGIGDTKDADIDGDGLSNESEKTNKTDPKKADTDGDKVNDNADAFPLDKTKTETRNTVSKEEATSLTENPLASASTNVLSTVSEKYRAVYEQIQQGIENFVELPPVQTIVEYVNNATGSNIENAYKAALSSVKQVSENAADTSETPVKASFADNLIRYKYGIIGGFIVLLVLWVLRRWRRAD